ncbi:MAG: GNAT family N-acetyltransferase [Dehalococcoidales bacterium]|nr:GNAT family N-acetyltransferase [Dehalococcoidales bacterium]
MRITSLNPEETHIIRQAAALLVEGFKDTGSDSWPDLEAGLKEVQACMQENRISLAVVDDSDAVLGWIGGIRQYNGHAWELHPLVVKPEFQRKGIGSVLVAALEAIVQEKGGTTIFLGTDDENYRTSLAGRDLYQDVLGNLAAIKNVGNHPFEFYLKAGFSLVGVIPDANGPGKPDILMAKRV